MKLSQGKVSLLRGAPALLAAAVLLSACQIGLAIQWDAHTPIDEVSITSHDPNESHVWLAGSDHDLQCSRSTDVDRCRKTAEDEWEERDDSVTHYWTATAGRFKDNDNVTGNAHIGCNVTYVCPNTARTATINVYADDNYDYPDPLTDNEALAEEGAQHDDVEISVIVPVVNQITYGGGNHTISDVTTPEYDRATSRNEPAAYTKSASSITAATTFWASTDLTEGSAVEVKGWTSVEEIYNWQGGQGTFGTSWPSASISNTSDIFVAWVNKFTYDTEWHYRCPTGSNQYIKATDQTGHVMYIVLDTPVRAEPEAAFEYSCKYCETMGDQSDAEDVCDAVLDGIAGDYTYSGTCALDSSNQRRLIGVQGVNGNLERWHTKDPNWNNGDIDAMYTISINPIGDDPNWPTGRTGWTNFHQWVTAAGHNWDASAKKKLSGNWGDYEDHLFNNGTNDDYRRHNMGWIANPAGQVAADHPGMTHGNAVDVGFTEP